jgi:hypothetical protein
MTPLKRVVGIHQPDFLPWAGFFYKILRSDNFVFLDDVQFVKNGYRNRVTIKTPQGAQWLTVPISHKFGQLITEVRINNQSKWKKKHLRTIEMNYKKSPFFNEVYPLLESAYGEREWEFLAPFNLKLIEIICGYLSITVKTRRSSTMKTRGASTGLLIDVVTKLHGTVYLSGTGGADYLEEDKFKEHAITLTYTDFKHPVYNQLWGEFIPGTSIIDLLFNCGAASRQHLVPQA